MRALSRSRSRLHEDTTLPSPSSVRSVTLTPNARRWRCRCPAASRPPTCPPPPATGRCSARLCPHPAPAPPAAGDSAGASRRGSAPGCAGNKRRHTGRPAGLPVWRRLLPAQPGALPRREAPAESPAAGGAGAGCGHSRAEHRPVAGGGGHVGGREAAGQRHRHRRALGVSVTLRTLEGEGRVVSS